jgi:hypothetical protein
MISLPFSVFSLRELLVGLHLFLYFLGLVVLDICTINNCGSFFPV